MVVGIADELKFGYEVGHVVLINSLKHMPHLFNLSTVQLRQLLILLQFSVSISQLALVNKIKN